jgi:pyruvate formate lyase activating enzyme
MIEQSAIVTEIRSLSPHDGPGLRTTLYFKGCSLKCQWCHNPETIGSSPEIEWDSKSCIDCRICEAECPEKAIAFSEPQAYIIDKNKCTACGLCVESCPSKALKKIGQPYTVHQLVERIQKDDNFIKRSNGGVTFSGGEPALQYPFIAELALKLKAHDYHLALDTCGAATAKAYETLVPLMDLILFDLKEMDNARHRLFTGGSNVEIHKNLTLILKTIEQHNLCTEVWIRTPLIPGMTNTSENIQGIGELISTKKGIQKWDLCTFNNLCVAKYRKLGQEWGLEHDELLSITDAANLLNLARQSVPEEVSVTLSGLTKKA